jgi:hypothetical protein
VRGLCAKSPRFASRQNQDIFIFFGTSIPLLKDTYPHMQPIIGGTVLGVTAAEARFSPLTSLYSRVSEWVELHSYTHIRLHGIYSCKFAFTFIWPRQISKRNYWKHTCSEQLTTTVCGFGRLKQAALIQQQHAMKCRYKDEMSDKYRRSQELWDS